MGRKDEAHQDEHRTVADRSGREVGRTSNGGADDRDTSTRRGRDDGTVLVTRTRAAAALPIFRHGFGKFFNSPAVAPMKS
jgi:hypothetical protein